MPLLAGDELLGVVTASWSPGQTPTDRAGELMLRLSGVADQAATALQGARLLSTVRRQALHDALTGLPNRVLFAERLEQALAMSTAAAVLFCDLDRFKQVNDQFGHAAGDELLRQVAHRLRSAVPASATLGRLSGDEFAVLLVDDADPQATASALVERFERPFRVEGHELRMTTSVGVALAECDELRPDVLLRAADTAMYAAKQRGRNQISVAGPSGPRRAPVLWRAVVRAGAAHGDPRGPAAPAVPAGRRAARPRTVGAGGPRGRGGRSARALGPPPAGPAVTRRLRAGRRGQRPRRRARPLGARRGHPRPRRLVGRSTRRRRSAWR